MRIHNNSLNMVTYANVAKYILTIPSYQGEKILKENDESILSDELKKLSIQDFFSSDEE